MAVKREARAAARGAPVARSLKAPTTMTRGGPWPVRSRAIRVPSGESTVSMPAQTRAREKIIGGRSDLRRQGEGAAERGGEVHDFLDLAVLHRHHLHAHQAVARLPGTPGVHRRRGL